MKIRRILATAAAVAVTTPAVVLSATPAFADTRPAGQAQNDPTRTGQAQTDSPQAGQAQAKPAQAKPAQAKPTLKELEKAAAEAQKAYDDAVAAEKIAYKVLEEALSETAPLTVAAKAAQKAADDAATAKNTADKAVTEARAELDKLTEEATEEQRTAAEKTLAEAEAAAKTAATAKTTADAEAKKAAGLAEDARVEANKTYNAVKAAVKEALDAKTAADAALARAREEENQGGGECVAEPGLTTTVTGFPSSVTAGTKTTFSVRVANGTDKEMEEVLTYAGIHGADKGGTKDTGAYLKLKWSTEASPKWKDADNDLYFDAVGALEPGAQADIKLRLDVDAKAPAGQGLTLITGGYFNEDGACGFAPEDVVYEFDIKAAADKPAPRPTPTPSASTPAAGSGVTPQGSGSSVPVTTTGGTLAATGSSDATTQIALAGGAAVLLGAGAMFAVRRRKAGADADA
ncbi:LPXTG cell wall anchor domain-containing protein [Streptomyces sp. NPDC057554]|uniref:LPXTG cell wall anchor domain-containing protein n=1 Tax=Streptomyces sp. NPDC057554 TaxID=3350538 RepID=UPI00367642C7